MSLNQYFSKVNQTPVIALTLVIAAGVGFSAGNLGSSGNSMDSGLEWSNQITIEKNGEQVDQFHNALTNQGRNYIAGKLFNVTANTGDATETTNNFAWIAVGNGTGVEPSFKQLGDGPGEINSANLSRSLADTYSYSSPTYTLEKKFTTELSSGNITVNTTGLYFDSYGSDQNSLISGGNFTEATLKDGDKLTVTHEITISDGS